jgi:hypothetical protein
VEEAVERSEGEKGEEKMGDGDERGDERDAERENEAEEGGPRDCVGEGVVNSESGKELVSNGRSGTVRHSVASKDNLERRGETRGSEKIIEGDMDGGTRVGGEGEGERKQETEEDKRGKGGAGERNGISEQPGDDGRVWKNEGMKEVDNEVAGGGVCGAKESGIAVRAGEGQMQGVKGAADGGVGSRQSGTEEAAETGWSERDDEERV